MADVTGEHYLEWVVKGGRHAERGMEELFKLYAARIKAFFRKHRINEDDISDLLQETFIKVFRSAQQFQGQSKVSTWIWTIARNTMLDHLRAKQPVDSLEDIFDSGDWSEMLSSCDQDEVASMQDCVRRGFLSFSEAHPDRAGAMQLAVFEGWSMDELASFLQRSPAATREYISQCRKKLKAFLDPCKEFVGA